MTHSLSLMPVSCSARAFLIICICWLCRGQLLAQTAPLPPLPPLDSLPAEQVASLASQLFIRAKAIEEQRAQTLLAAQTERNTQEQNLKLAKQDSSIAKSVLDSLDTHLKAARLAERAAGTQLKKARKAASYCEKTAVMDAATQRTQLPKAWQQVNALLETEPPSTDAAASDAPPVKPLKLRFKKPKAESSAEDAPIPSVAEDAPPAADTTAAKSRNVKTSPPAQPRYATYDAAQDVMLHPPTPPCRLDVESRDEFTGATLRQTQAHDLFRFTTPALRTYLEGKDQIMCQAAISTAGASSNLLLTFFINDPNGRRAFGSLAKNGLAILTFTDGTFLNLSNVRPDEGSTAADSPSSKTIIYRAQYPLDVAALRKMRSTELDRLRIHWGTGYEEYDVQQVDALMYQIPCATGQ